MHVGRQRHPSAEAGVLALEGGFPALAGRQREATYRFTTGTAVRL